MVSCIADGIVVLVREQLVGFYDVFSTIVAISRRGDTNNGCYTFTNVTNLSNQRYLDRTVVVQKDYQ